MGPGDEARFEPRSKMLSVTREFNVTLPLSTVAGYHAHDHVRHVIVLHNMLTQHIWESLQVIPGPFPNFCVGPGDEASSDLLSDSSNQTLFFHVRVIPVQSAVGQNFD